MSYLLSFEINTKGDFETTQGKYIDYNKTIYFIPTIKLTKELASGFINLDKDLKATKDYKKIFTSMNKFISFINYISNIKNNKDYKKLTLKQAKEQGIIESNIEFIKNIFFYPKNDYYIYGRKYIIYSSNLLLPTLRIVKGTGTTTNESTTAFASSNIFSGSTPVSNNTTYKIVVELVLLDASKQDLEGDFRKLSCNEKAKMLDKEALELFDFSLNLAKEEPVKFSKTMKTTPALYSSKYTQLGPYNKMLYQKEVEKRKAEDIKKLQELVKTSGWEDEKKKREQEKERAKVLADLKEAERWLEEKRKKNDLSTGGKNINSRYRSVKPTKRRIFSTTKTNKKTKSRKTTYHQLKKGTKTKQKINRR